MNLWLIGIILNPEYILYLFLRIENINYFIYCSENMWIPIHIDFILIGVFVFELLFIGTKNNYCADPKAIETIDVVENLAIAFLPVFIVAKEYWYLKIEVEQ